MRALRATNRAALSRRTTRGTKGRGQAGIAGAKPRAMAVDATVHNPLLKPGKFPAFDQVKAEHVVPGIRNLLQELGMELEELEKNADASWDSLVVPLERITDQLGRAWGTVSHLKSVKDTEELRKAVEEVQPEQVAFGLRLSQSKPLYEAFCKIRDEKWSELNEAQRRIVETEIRDATLGGVGLEGEAKDRFNEIQQELSKLSTDFSNNVLDSTKAWKKLIEDPSEVKGLPPSALGLLSQQAAREGHQNANPENGPWLITLDAPSYIPIMQYCENRSLREETYKAYITRASEGSSDNKPLIERILELRLEKAKLLGYQNFAEMSMARKMATLQSAERLLGELREASYDAAVKDLEEVKNLAKAKGAPEGDDFKHWDGLFWAEKLREDRFQFSEEELRPYFSLPRVLDGLFGLVERIFDVQVSAADGLAPVWDKDVRFFCIKDKTGSPLSYFYLDPYSRPSEKRGGAWMDEVVGRSKVFADNGEAARLPIAHMVCNQTPPVGEDPSLMTFREVETLFHEFGHALQHMLTRVDEGFVSGIRGVEWDAVELPSQFMENWCYHRDTLMGMAKHYKSGETLPEDLYQKLLAARTFRAGTMTLRQLHFACTDLELHARYVPGEGRSVFDVEREVAKSTTVMPPLPEDRFLCGFAHIFAGGYSAGYYSYKWAEVLSADAFSAFEDAGLDDDQAVVQTGQRFRNTVLAMGGSRPPLEVFVEFRGREPSTEALLRHNGLISATN
eukprot:scaffold1347_cov350-Pavlova_lutheri.AAC.69